MSADRLWYLAAELSNLREAFSRKTAVLCPLEQFDDAGVLRTLRPKQRLQISAFTSFEDAIEWLSANGPDA